MTKNKLTVLLLMYSYRHLIYIRQLEFKDKLGVLDDICDQNYDPDLYLLYNSIIIKSIYRFNEFWYEIIVITR